MIYLIAPVSIVLCIASLTFMYVYLLKLDRKVSFFLPVIIIEYIDKTKKSKGYIGVWFWAFLISFIIGLLTVFISPA